MIVIITLPGHEYTLQSLAERTFGWPVPELRVLNYDHMLRVREVPRATYVFTDIERLSAWELRLAAELYTALRAKGLRCLNNPALAMSRVELLRTLKAVGINPFNVWRGDERPHPTRFPVFVRGEFDHEAPMPQTITTQRQLDAALGGLKAQGRVPLRGTLVIEICAKPYSPGLWHKWGTFRIGDRMAVDHIGVDDTWYVKYGVREKLTEAAMQDERDAVLSNRFADELKPVFDIAQIEFGRADHATIGKRSVVYEINTNPFLPPYKPDISPFRVVTREHARQRLAECFTAIDTAGTGTVEIDPTELLQRIHALPAFAMTPRP
jgi:hypothetical protein